MKHFKNIAKMILYMILGGLLAFIIVFISSYMKASAVAGDISRNALLLATQEGCINHDTAQDFCNNMANSYGTKNLIVANYTKNSATDVGILQTYQDTAITNWNPTSTAVQNKTTCGLIWVESDTGRGLINENGRDYENHVQRGSTIRVVTTVEANIHINFLFGSEHPLTFTFPVQAEATGISCRWFKGES